MENYSQIKFNKCSSSFLLFYKELELSELFIAMLFKGNKYLTANMESLKMDILKMYKENAEDSESVEDYIKSKDEIFNIHFYENFYSNMSYVKIVDNTITYFKDVLSEIISLNPSILKSKDSERMDYILSFDAMEDFIKDVTEKKVEGLFYKNIEAIEKYFYDRIGIKIFDNEVDKRNFILLIKRRNLLVHNRGILNSDFVKQFPEAKNSKGEQLLFDFEDISQLNLYVNNLVVKIDQKLIQKFELKTITIS